MLNITLLEHPYSKHIDRYLTIDSILNLPKGYSDKKDSPLWSPHKLDSRKVEDLPSVKVSHLVYDYDFHEEPILARYQYYKHKTHSGKWRFVVPLQTPQVVDKEEFDALYKTVSYMIGLPPEIKEESKEGYDTNAARLTNFYFLPPPDANVTLVNDGFDKVDPLCVKSKIIKRTSDVFIPKWYARVDEALLTRFRRLHMIFKDYACVSQSFLSDRARFECHFHTPSVESNLKYDVVVNEKPFSIYSYHGSCNELLVNSLKRSSDLSDDEIRSLKFTELYLLTGLAERKWDWHQIERMYMTPFLYDNYGSAIKLTSEVVTNAPLVLDMIHGEGIIYDVDEDSFYKYIDEQKSYELRKPTQLTMSLTTEIYKWLAYKYTKYSGNKGDSMLSHKDHMLDYVRSRGYGNVRTPDCLNLSNGLLMLAEDFDKQCIETIFTEHTPKYFPKSRIKLPYAYDKGAGCPLFIETLYQMFGENHPCIKMLQEFFGYCLISTRRYEKFLIMYGITRSGKTTLSRILQYIVGGGTSSLEELHTKPVVRFSHYRKKMIWLDELASALNTKTRNGGKMVEFLKQLVSSGDIPVRNHYDNERTVSNFPKLVMCFNTPPQMDSLDPALKERMLVIRFTNSFAGHTNTRLYDQLIEEAPGILAWAIRGLERLIKNDKFTENPNAVEDLKAEMTDDIESYLDIFYVLLPYGVYGVKFLMDAFNAYLEHEQAEEVYADGRNKMVQRFTNLFETKLRINNKVVFVKPSPKVLRNIRIGFLGFEDYAKARGTPRFHMFTPEDAKAIFSNKDKKLAKYQTDHANEDE